MTVCWFSSPGGGGCEFGVQGHGDKSPDEIAPLPDVCGRGPPLAHHRGEGGAPALNVGLHQVFARGAVSDERDNIHWVQVGASVAMARAQVVVESKRRHVGVSRGPFEGEALEP